MDRFAYAGSEISRICEDNGLEFRNILSVKGVTHQWNISYGRKLITFWPTTGTCITKDASLGKIEIDKLIRVVNMEFGLNITPVYLSSLVKPVKKISKSSTAKPHKIFPVNVATNKVRYFLEGASDFHSVYKFGFKTRKSLAKAYNWYINHK